MARHAAVRTARRNASGDVPQHVRTLMSLGLSAKVAKSVARDMRAIEQHPSSSDAAKRRQAKMLLDDLAYAMSGTLGQVHSEKADRSVAFFINFGMGTGTKTVVYDTVNGRFSVAGLRSWINRNKAKYAIPGYEIAEIEAVTNRTP